MDHRYFHRIREEAAKVLVKCAKESTDWIGLFHLEKAFQELFCYADSPMPRRNDFSDRALYYIQCAIPRAIGKVRDRNGRASRRVRSFLLEKLKFNDNSDNEFSDGHYLALLMRALAEAVATNAPPSTNDINDQEFTASMESLEEMEDPRFHAACLDQIERYRRADEWIPSYQNILSTTALDCKRMLIAAGHIKLEPRDFLQYTSNRTSDILCLSAFDNLLQLDVMRHTAVIQWFLFVLGHDPSPYIRVNLLMLFGRTLGALAIGSHPSCHSKAQVAGANRMTNGQDTATSGSRAEELVIEHDSSGTSALRAANLERQHKPKAALKALQKEIYSDDSNEYSKEQKRFADDFGMAIWEGVVSSVTTLAEKDELLEICLHLYDTENGQIVRLRYPRYWRCEKLRSGRFNADKRREERSLVLHFYQTDKIRTNMQPESSKWHPPPGPKVSATSRPGPPLHAHTFTSIQVNHSTPSTATLGSSSVDRPNKETPPPTTSTSGTKLKLFAKKDNFAEHHRAATMSETPRPYLKHEGSFSSGTGKAFGVPPAPASAGLLHTSGNAPVAVGSSTKKLLFKPLKRPSLPPDAICESNIGQAFPPIGGPTASSTMPGPKPKKRNTASGASTPDVNAGAPANSSMSPPATPAADGPEDRPKKVLLKFKRPSGGAGASSP